MATRCSSSLRTRDPIETLDIARAIAPSLGITRVTQVTRLDRIGLPVFVAIRPDAEPGSICVHAGKGLQAVEAEVGATMEGVELAWAEYRRCRDTIAVRTVKTGDLGSLAGIVELCPRWGTLIDLEAPMTAVVARDLVDDTERLVPIEAVVHPRPAALPGVAYFPTHSNGLASGNTVLEATIHALAEVLERDTLSFHALVARGRPIANETLPEALREIEARLDARQFRLVVRWLPNPYGLPAFSAVIFDRHQPELTSPGDGLHPVREIALVRAITESAQARLAFIHGGRDDLAEVYARYQHLTSDQKAELFERRLAALAADEPMDYRDVPDRSDECLDLQSTYELLLSAARGVAGRAPLRVEYTPADYPLKVVRVVVPRLELYTPETGRIGPRLLAAIRG